jgi:putative endonuclease
MYYIYILYSDSSDKYYVGHSSAPWNRLQQHLNNSGDKYTGSYKDWRIIAVFEASLDRGEAMRIEKLIKKQKSRNLIEKMITPGFSGAGILAPLVRVPHVRD